MSLGCLTTAVACGCVAVCRRAGLCSCAVVCSCVQLCSCAAVCGCVAVCRYAAAAVCRHAAALVRHQRTLLQRMLVQVWVRRPTPGMAMVVVTGQDWVEQRMCSLHSVDALTR